MGEAPERPGLLLGDDVDYWVAVAAWVLDLLQRRRIVPAFEDGHARWRPVFNDPHEKDRADLFAQAMPPSSRAIGWPGASAEGLYPTSAFLLRGVVDDLADAAARELLLEGIPDARRRAGSGPEGLALSLLAARRDGREEEMVAEAIPAEVAERFSAWSLPLLEAAPRGRPAPRTEAPAARPRVRGDPGVAARLPPRSRRRPEPQALRRGDLARDLLEPAAPRTALRQPPGDPPRAPRRRRLAQRADPAEPRGAPARWAPPSRSRRPGASSPPTRPS